MSETEQLEVPINVKRAEWVERSLGYKFRSGQGSATLNNAINSTRQSASNEAPLPPGTKPTREQTKKGSARSKLLERLKDLKMQAVLFASVAPQEEYAKIAGLIDQVEKSATAADWTQAHADIARAAQAMDDLHPACLKLRDLHAGLQSTTLKLDKLMAVLPPEAFKSMDTALLDLETRSTIDNTEAGTAELAKIDQQLATLEQDAVQRLGRLKILQNERAIAEAAAKALTKRATSLQLLTLETDAGILHARLTKLATSDDEQSLKDTLAAFEKLTSSSATDIEEAEKQAARAARTDQLKELADRRDTLVSENAKLVSTAIDGTTADAEESLEELGRRLLVSPDNDGVVDQAETAFNLLDGSYKNLRIYIDSLGVLQRQLSPRLKLYLQEVAGRDEDDELTRDEEAADEAFAEIPKALQDPSASTWATDAAWDLDNSDDGWHPRDFLKAWAKKAKNDAEAQEEENYQDKKSRYPGIRKPFDQISKKAPPGQRKTGTDLLAEIDKLLVTRQQESLTNDEAKQIEKQFTDLGKLVSDIKDHVAGKRDDAKKIDKDDGAHTVARHGPDVSDSQLQNRLTTGYGPDKIFSPTAKSCKFNSYDDLIDTREAAFAEAADATGHLSETDLFGAARDLAPDPNAVGARRRTEHIVNNDHSPRVIGTGFKGAGDVTDFPIRGQKFSSFTAMPPLTKTYTKIKWEPGKGHWIAIQHFPTDV